MININSIACKVSVYKGCATRNLLSIFSRRYKLNRMVAYKIACKLVFR